MRLLFDEDLSPLIAEVARNLGLDAVSVHKLGRRGFSDREQLVFAAAERRTLVTRNRDDYIKLTVEFYAAGNAHWGVLIVPWSMSNSRAERIAHALKRWAAAQPEDQYPRAYRIDFLPA
jgi:predicted nuclease of predicted toxin-antitoxin system